MRNATIVAIALVCSAPGCNWLVNPVPADLDAGTEDAGSPDIIEIGPFEPLTPIGGPFDPGLEKVNEDDPTLTADLLEMYFNSNRDGGGEGIWSSKRASRDDPWLAPTRIPEIENAIENPTDPAISPDGLTLWVSNAPEVGDDREIHRFARDSREAEQWTLEGTEEALESPQREGAGGITDDGLTFVLMSDRDPLTRFAVFMATRESSSADWSLVPEGQLEEVNFRCRNQSPSISPDGRVLIWGSFQEPCRVPSRPYVARWDEGSETFVRDAIAQQALDALGDDGMTYDDPWLSADGGYIILVRQNGEDIEDRRLYHAVRLASQ